MARRVYHQAELEKGTKEYIPGMNILAGNKKPVITQEQIERIRIQIKFGMSIAELAKAYGVPEYEINRYL
jgi:hypothetical protein